MPGVAPRTESLEGFLTAIKCAVVEFNERKKNDRRGPWIFPEKLLIPIYVSAIDGVTFTGRVGTEMVRFQSVAAPCIVQRFRYGT